VFQSSSLTLFDFDTDSNLYEWNILDDVVMGGRSDGNLALSEEGHGVYSGYVSLENNGGFSSVRLNVDAMDASNHTSIVLRVKGDGKPYQVRLKSSRKQYFSYVNTFETEADVWTDVELTLADFYPTFRGRTLDMANYDGMVIEEMGLLIGNKKNESFKLEIDKIYLK
jgi:hypothetical protein